MYSYNKIQQNKDRPWNYRYHNERQAFMDAQNNERIKSIKNIELIKLFNRTLGEYEGGIMSEWRLSPPDIDDAMNVAYTRDNLDVLVHEFRNRGLLFDKEKLARLDIEWKQWIKRCIDEGDVNQVLYPNNDEPNDKWWMHIESLG